jgi:SulP family sulfate permease
MRFTPWRPDWRADLRNNLRNYRREALRDDLVAAFVISVLLIPQSLAYALLAGLPAQVGLYASLLPLVAYAALGSSPVLGVGPAAVLALMIAQAIGQAPPGVEAPAVALVLAAEVGLLLLFAAWLRLDALAALLSVPVLHGFETGATLSIALSQLPVLLGSSARGADAVQVLHSWWQAVRPWAPLTAAYGVGAVALLWFTRRHAQPWLAARFGRPRAVLVGRLVPLAVLIGAMAVAMLTRADQHGVTLVGALPTLSPTIALPLLDAALWWGMLPQALLIALVAYVSSLVVAESLARRLGQRVDPRRELAGLGAANVAAALTGGMPVSASFSRSIVSLEAGSRTRMAGVFTAILMVLAMLLLAQPLAWLPTPVLAATILVAVLSGLALGPFREAWHYARSEWVVMVTVAVLMLLLGAGWSLGVGVAASIALLLQRTARPHVALIGRVPGTEHYRNIDRYQVELTPGVLALRIDESLLFTNARQLEDVVAQHLATHPDTRRVLLQMAPVNRIDLSGLEALRALQDMLAARGMRLDLSEVKGPVMDGLRAGGWQQWFKGQVFLSVHQGVVAGAGIPQTA